MEIKTQNTVTHFNFVFKIGEPKYVSECAEGNEPLVSEAECDGAGSGDAALGVKSLIKKRGSEHRWPTGF